MLGLLKVVLGSIVILGSIGYVGNDCTLPDLTPQAAVVEEVDHDYNELERLRKEIQNLYSNEIEEYLIANNIQYTIEDVNTDDSYISIIQGDWQLEILYKKDSDYYKPYGVSVTQVTTKH